MHATHYAEVVAAGGFAEENRTEKWVKSRASMDAWEKYFREQEIPYLPRRRRPDGAFQIYLIDPDGHYVELCTAVPVQ